MSKLTKEDKKNKLTKEDKKNKLTKEDKERYEEADDKNISWFRVIEHVSIKMLIILSWIYTGTHWAFNELIGAYLFLGVATIFEIILFYKIRNNTNKLMKLAEDGKLLKE